jgi:hypothetical protein
MTRRVADGKLEEVHPRGSNAIKGQGNHEMSDIRAWRKVKEAAHGLRIPGINIKRELDRSNIRAVRIPSVLHGAAVYDEGFLPVNAIVDGDPGDAGTDDLGIGDHVELNGFGDEESGEFHGPSIARARDAGQSIGVGAGMEKSMRKVQSPTVKLEVRDANGKLLRPGQYSISGAAELVVARWPEPFGPERGARTGTTCRTQRGPETRGRRNSRKRHRSG